MTNRISAVAPIIKGNNFESGIVKLQQDRIHLTKEERDETVYLKIEKLENVNESGASRLRA